MVDEVFSVREMTAAKHVVDNSVSCEGNQAVVCECAFVSDAGSLGMQHFYEEVVARHLSAQVFVAQVVFGLRAQRSELGKAQQNLAKPVRELRIRIQRVLQQRGVHLLVHALDVRLVFQQFHICRGTDRVSLKTA